MDFITDGRRAAQVANGHEMMPRITVLGCSLNGIIAAFITGQPHFEATVAALSYYALAGEKAGAVAAGPGSFQVAFIDALYNLTADEVNAGARITLA